MELLTEKGHVLWAEGAYRQVKVMVKGLSRGLLWKSFILQVEKLSPTCRGSP